jgi:RimJ/RimL family protein N-acetyltransferase
MGAQSCTATKYTSLQLCKGKAAISLDPLNADESRTELGTALMNLVGEIAARIPGTEKVMLTCFTSNVRGVKFYEQLGYAKDEFSPQPKVLRNGTKVEAEYVILSKDRR